METVKTTFKKLKTSSLKERDLIIYNLLLENESEYGIECYLENNIDTDYCFINNISHNFETVNKIFKLVSNKNVYPIHLKDIIEDLYTY